jgi:hypothetical protein
MIEIYIGVRVTYTLFLPDFNEFESSEFWKVLKNKISSKSSSRNRVVPWEQTGRHDEINNWLISERA